MEDKTILAVIGVISIVILEMFAIYEGINGTALATVVGTIAGIVGLAFGVKLGQKT